MVCWPAVHASSVRHQRPPPDRTHSTWEKCRPRGMGQKERKLQSCPTVAPQALGSQFQERGPPLEKRTGGARRCQRDVRLRPAYVQTGANAKTLIARVSLEEAKESFFCQ